MPPKRKLAFTQLNAFDTAVGLGIVEGVDAFSTQGFSGAPLTPDLETDITTIPESELDLITIPGLATIHFPDNNGEAMEIVSDSIADVGDVQIFALGPGGAYIEPFTVTLQGLTPVALPTPNLYSRINFIRNIRLAGIFGRVVIRAAGGGDTFIDMIALHQNSTQCRYTIPAGKKGLLKTAVGSMRKQGGTDTTLAILIHTKPFDFAQFYHPFGFGLQRSGATTVSLVNAYPEAIDGPFDVAVSANSSAAGAEAAARIAGLIIDI
jgi:hypothetical protein